VTAPDAEVAIGALLRGLEFDAIIFQATGADARWSGAAARANAGQPVQITPLLALGAPPLQGLAPHRRIHRLPHPTQLYRVVSRFMDRTVLKPHAPAQVRLGAAVFDLSSLSLTVGGVDTALSQTEGLLLRSLALNAYTPMPRKRLRPDHPDGRGVDVAIHRLRRRLGDDPVDPKYLKTVRGKGYLLLPDPLHDLRPTSR
jgi:two-component system phosphate regulon response regulator OmpR